VSVRQLSTVHGLLSSQRLLHTNGRTSLHALSAYVCWFVGDPVTAERIGL
jgi:hypothetical protein